MLKRVFTVTDDEVKYPYIEEMKQLKPNKSKIHIHLNKNLYIEMNPQASPSIAIVEHGDPNSGNIESMTFEWEYYNYPHKKFYRDMFGRLDLYSSGSGGKIRFPGNFTFGDKDLTVSEVLDGYRRYKKIREALYLIS